MKVVVEELVGAHMKGALWVAIWRFHSMHRATITHTYQTIAQTRGVLYISKHFDFINVHMHQSIILNKFIPA